MCFELFVRAIVLFIKSSLRVNYNYFEMIVKSL